MDEVILVVVIIIFIILTIAISAYLIRKQLLKKRDEEPDSELTGGDLNINEKTVLGDNSISTYIILDTFPGKDELLNSIVNHGKSYMTVDTSSNESVRSRVKREITNVIWPENDFTIISQDFHSAIEVANELKTAGYCVIQIILLTKPTSDNSSSFPIAIVERNSELEPKQIRRIYGENWFRDYVQIGKEVDLFNLLGIDGRMNFKFRDADPISQAMNKLGADYGTIVEYYDRLNAGIHDFASKRGMILYSENLKFVGAGSYNVVFTFDDIGIEVLRVNYKSLGFRPELLEEQYELLEQENTGFARVNSYAVGEDFEWSVVEKLFPIQMPIDNEKMSRMCKNIREFFNRVSNYFGFADYASRNIMQNGSGEYVIADIDLLLIDDADGTINKETTLPFEEHIDDFVPLSSMRLTLELIRSIYKKNNPSKKKIASNEISIMAVKLFELAKYRIGLYVTEDILKQFK